MKKLCSTFFFFLMALFAYAQETQCGNGIDDDGDGFIDCFDGDCRESADCEGFYVGNDVECQATPNQFPAFSMTLDFATPDSTADHIGRMAIGDLDRDGIPDIVTQSKYADKLFILDGASGNIKSTTTIDGQIRPSWRVAIGNIDDDNCGEVFSVEEFFEFRNDGTIRVTDYRISAYDCNLNKLWSSDEVDGERMERDPVHMGLADFNRDGRVELYYKDEVRDARTGTLIIKSPDDGKWNAINGGPVAVDIRGGADLELVSGGTIFNVNLGNGSAGSGSLTSVAKMPTLPGGKEYRVKRKESSTSIADYNQDGFLDVITTGKDSENITTVFFWDVENNALKMFNDPIPKVSPSTLKCSGLSVNENDYALGWKNGTGRLNIGDLDGDGQLNVSFVSGRFLYALDENFNQKWRADVNEETSGFTGCTLFDFNADGKTEVVYRDEQWLYIINGTDGTVFTQKQCISRTSVDYPIVADVDADGSTEICVLCGTIDAVSGDKKNFCDLEFSAQAQVRIYKSDSEPWVPARRLWNQHGYFNANVNDDLSIPVNLQKHHLVWSTGSCTQGPNRPLNNFLNQSPFLDSQGCPVYVSPDLSFVQNSLSIDQPLCPERDFNVSFRITNQGDAALSGDVPVSFYNGDPFQAGATYLETEVFNFNNFSMGDTLDVNNITVTGPGSAFTLFIVLNDNGSTIPTPVSLPNTEFLECEYNDNVIQGLVGPDPFPVTAVGTDDVRCGTSAPPNGSARAFRLVGSAEETADYIFNWYDGTVVSGAPDFQGAIYTGLDSGTYSVFATHVSALCSSDTVQVVVGRTNKPINVTINITNNTNCKNPNGTLTAVVNGGEPSTNFDFKWFQFGSSDILSIDPELTGLSEGVNYVVEVTEKSTGCSFSQSDDVNDDLPPFSIDVQVTNISCSTDPLGAVSVEVTGVGIVGHTFEWYIGNTVTATPDFVGNVRNNLAAGPYTVVATNNATGCTSNPETVTIERTVPPAISSLVGTPMTSCDAGLPNGTATVNFTGATNVTIEWFEGQNTNAANLLASNTNNTTATGLAQGTYTVKVTDTDTGCDITDDVLILPNVVTPTLSLNKTDVTSCAPFNGSITASVTPGNISDYTFSYYDGSSVKSSPDYAETGNVLNGLVAGTYTVVAFNNTTNCVSQTASIIITAPVINISLDGSASSFPSDCSANSGVLTVNIIPNTASYDISWYDGVVDPATSTAFFNQTGVNSSTASNLTAGNYTVLAVNTVTGCEEVGIFNLPLANRHELALVNASPATTCLNNNGDVTVRLTPTTLAGFNQDNYSIELYEGTSVSGSPRLTIPGSAGTPNGGTPATFNYEFTGLDSGTYVITAIPDNLSITSCENPVILATIEFDVQFPIVEATTIDANTNCLGTAANGLIEIAVNSGARPLSDFNINWFTGEDTSTPLSASNVSGANNEQAINLEPGFYTVSVEDIVASPAGFTGCSTTRTFQIRDNTPVISVAAADLAVTPFSRCDINTGAAVINNVNENGTPGNLASYTFEWFDASNNILPTAAAPNTSNAINDLTPGNYFVRAFNTVNSCITTLIQFEIEDETINDPSISLISSQNPTICRQDDDGDNTDNDNLLGFLEVQVIGNSTTGYTIIWREDNSIGSIVTGVGASNERIENLTFSGPTKQYHVSVTNNDSQCTVEGLFTLQLEQAPIFTRLSATPVTNCETPNGSVFATVSSGGSNAYSYDWTNVTTSSGIGSGKLISGLDAGEYSVVIVDPNNPAECRAVESINIELQQTPPNLMVEEVAPITVCDISLANGVARASVDGSFIGHTFEWYVGSTVSGAPAYVGTEFTGLEAQTYTVVATNDIDRCSTTAQITIGEDIPQVFDPTIEIISHVTSCEFDNGVLSVSVNGETSNYIFDWFNGQQATGTPDFTGEIYSNLSVGPYTVIATDRTTGCVSNPVTEVIIEDKDFPEFEFIIQNASCSQSNGFASLSITNDVVVDSIAWETPDGGVVVGPNLTEVPAGEYTVNVWTTLGCFVSEDFTILSEINPYNGVSRNGDGLNDIFLIECIEDFPNNVVKIFNRAGTLVYEDKGYDNSSVFFDGVSNKGMRITGTNLPDGTYFYVIDKGDESEPLAGYMEIVN
ncbi:hypothetical protein FNH22_24220 [Fulvivirga sp. M361]|uniref:T9SS type B sorting domain-containing protein n=1 Tax=Fulvivirga sp. M361 TaxID=2594266 RepID=UPI00117A4D98|nr:gliding motility-associated C-terminal domain-containing protein [Fulvivirga sp. M361]TRX51400.1 hypothetical protein FNH22_24220 [Fulvivirga sp. M361]